MGDGEAVTLILRNGETWRISSNAEHMAIEDSVLLADQSGPQSTSQVVLTGMMGEARELRILWKIERTSDAHPQALDDPADDAGNSGA